MLREEQSNEEGATVSWTGICVLGAYQGYSFLDRSAFRLEILRRALFFGKSPGDSLGETFLATKSL